MIMTLLQVMVRRIAVNPALFRIIRNIINFGNLQTVIVQAIDVAETDEVIDVGCGIGDLCTIVGGKYYGVDVDPNYIRYAKKRYGSDKRIFEVLDIKHLHELDAKRFDKAFYIGMLHHFSDLENFQILQDISRITKEQIIIFDLVPSSNPIKRFLCSLDRGEYLRPIEKQRELIEKVLAVKHLSTFDTRSKSATLAVSVCTPRT